MGSSEIEKARVLGARVPGAQGGDRGAGTGSGLEVRLQVASASAHAWRARPLSSSLDDPMALSAAFCDLSLLVS